MTQADTITRDHKADVSAEGFTARIVADASRLSAAELTAKQLVRTKHAVLDWLGVSIAGAFQPSAEAAQAVARAEGGSPVARVLGKPEKLTARQAALVVGVAGHALDYDDMGFLLHPSVPFLPAVFAVAEEVDASGQATVEAIVQGYEALRMISAACGQASYARGYHCTGTVGAFGAALGVGRLIGLNQEQLVMALGIAGTQASGLKASFGTMAKHLNAGNAAAVGVLAARLAQQGFTGAADIIESAQGFAAAHNQGPADFDPSNPEAFIGDTLGVEQIIFKLHAACGGTHSAINGIRQIKARRPFGYDDLDEVELTVSEQLPTVCGIPEPTTSLEAMFSIRYATALAIVDSGTGPSAFTLDRVRDPWLATVRQKVRVTTVARIAHTGSPTEVTVRLKNGETYEACLDALVITPDSELDLQWRNLEAKFRDIVEPLLGHGRTGELIELVQRIETLKSIRELTDATVGAH